MQQGRSDDGRQCRNAWSGFEKKSQEVGSERKSEEEEVPGEILDHQQEQGLPKEPHEGGGQEVVTSGRGASEDVESACSGDGPSRKIYIEETDGSSSGQKENDIVVPFSWRPLASKWRRNFPLWPLNTGQKEPGWEDGIMNKKEAWMKQVREVQSCRQVRGFAGAVMCETRDLGIKWPYWHTLICEGD